MLRRRWCLGGNLGTSSRLNPGQATSYARTAGPGRLVNSGAWNGASAASWESSDSGCTFPAVQRPTHWEGNVRGRSRFLLRMVVAGMYCAEYSTRPPGSQFLRVTSSDLSIC